MARIRRTSTRNNTNNALRSYISFQKRGTVNDGYGNQVPGGAFVHQFYAYANFRPLLRGSATGVEDVFADRLQGNQPYILTVRNTSDLEEVTVAWRVVDARNANKFYNIKSPPIDVTNADLWREFIVVQDQPS